MKRDHRALSEVRERSPFATPPHILVVADTADIGEAVELAEALDECGADAEVRLTADAAADFHGEADAVIFAGAAGDSGVFRHGAVRVAVTDERASVSGYDFVVNRPVNPSALMRRLGERLPSVRH
ncbi:hypothetical protein R5W23_005693 [Gemmata sp. JC673]|uniref:Uncharacterized protein n=1 Tax=Gemmata algarum TaxID=2975278 RepID=A0ABU5ETB8_9BACT|nr:hypothetical protein [Gemmata algarum]MDY3558573.1 hypothetical protein [Gemmata algarum]